MQILDIQRRLKDLGFDPGPLDGKQGPKTTRAVRSFQRSRGLTADGIVGPKTRAEMEMGTREIPGLQDFPWLKEAYQLMGVQEIPGEEHSDQILSWAHGVGLGGVYTEDEIPWCGLFVAHCVSVGLPDEQIPLNPLTARNWIGLGERSESPGLGDVLVFWRGSRDGWMGHVGFYVGETEAHYLVLGGNQRDSVSISKISKRRLLQARRPSSATGGPGRQLESSGEGITVTENEA